MTPGAAEDHSKTVRDTLSRNVTVDIAARIGYLITRFFIPPFVLAHMSLEAYGLWSTAFILVSYIGVSTLGVSNVYVKYVAEYAARREYERANTLVSTGVSIMLPVCAAVFAVIYTFWPRVVDWLGVKPALRADAKEVVLIVVAIFLASIALSFFRDVLAGVQNTAAVQAVWVICYLLETGLILLLVGQGRGIRGLAEAFLVRTLLEIVLYGVIALRTLPWLRLSPGRFSKDCLRELFAFGGTVQVLSLLAIALNSIERAIAVPLVGLEAAGLLDIGKKLPGMAASVPSAFASSLMPAASYLKGGLEGKEEEREALRKLYLKGGSYMNLSAAYVCGLLAVIPLPLLDVWLGRRYPGAAFLMVVFCIATQVHLMTGPGTSILKGIGRPQEEFYYALPNVMALLVTVPASRWLLGRWDAVGIGTAVAAATLLSAVFFLRRANRLLRIPGWEYFRRVVVPGVAPYLVGLVVAYPATRLIEGVSRWTGAAYVILTGMVYSALLAVVVDRFVWEKGERLWFHAVIRARLGRLLPARQAA
ncbi:MAG TPA: polysaccharide biosynthesis C-terminal domain-containing protein [Bryobacteraceae bacterium]|nr:polysaccharide biosynthesis C-terminal domain-containing protein [Bryobacteraceae bacterium]